MATTTGPLLGAEHEADVERARGGDLDALSRVFMRLRPRVQRTAYRVIGDAHEAEDTAQDAFLCAVASLPRLADARAFECWLLRIARNRAVDRRRRLRRCRPDDVAHDDSGLSDTASDPPVRRSGVAEPPPDSVASLRASLHTLAPPLRRVLRQRYLLGLGYADIASADGISVGAVKTRLFRARRHIRRALLADEARGRLSEAPRKRRAARVAEGPDLAEKA